MNHRNYLLDSYDYALPPELVAQYPRDQSCRDRLLIMDKMGQRPAVHTFFDQLADFLPQKALLIVNNTKVTHCRLQGTRKNGGHAEFLLLTPLPLLSQIKPGEAEVEGLLRPASKCRIGDCISFANGKMRFLLTKKGEYGQCKGMLEWQGDVIQLIEEIGLLPLPPYIHRKPSDLDESRYQTVYAKYPGSAAAPTAGLHFTNNLKKSLLGAGHEWGELTLHVGYGTFSPVRSTDIREHQMHAEYVELPAKTAQLIKKARAEERSIIAVGTTSLRAMEGVFCHTGQIEPFKGWINIFLYPGCDFHIAGGLLTNFHLPKSTLLMLVSAFAGRKNILAHYQEAIRRKYNFFSYGDAMLITSS